MTFIIRNSDGNIKTFSERADDFILSAGETIDISPLSFAEYAQRLVLSAFGRSGEIIRVPAGSPAVSVLIDCPGQSLLNLDINGTIEQVILSNGLATLQLSTAVPGVFTIQAADRKLYAAAGNSIMVVEVLA